MCSKDVLARNLNAYNIVMLIVEYSCTLVRQLLTGQRDNLLFLGDAKRKQSVQTVVSQIQSEKAGQNIICYLLTNAIS